LLRIFGVIMIIEGKDITKHYGELQILKGVDIAIREEEVVSIVGSSGAGKTTLLTILGTLDKPDNGQLFIKGENVFALNDKKLAAFRNQHIGFVFQFHHLLPEFTAIENVCMPAFIAKTQKKEAEKKAEELLELLGLKTRAQHKPNELSGGEQQRVAVARALINNPAVVFADEPSGNLDTKNAAELHQLFFTLRDRFKQTFVIVTHNNELAKMADRKIEMKDGLILETDQH
jgi:lipoprotein-releasing system ATP-binding protein